MAFTTVFLFTVELNTQHLLMTYYLLIFVLKSIVYDTVRLLHLFFSAPTYAGEFSTMTTDEKRRGRSDSADDALCLFHL